MVSISINKKASLGRRIGAFLIDYFMITFIEIAAFIWSYPLFESSGKHPYIPLLIALGAISLFLLKDAFYGRSLGKWLFGLVVRNDNEHKDNPSVIKLALRNITIFIWPVELLMILFSKEQKKFGDKLACTDVYIISNTENKGF